MYGYYRYVKLWNAWAGFRTRLAVVGSTVVFLSMHLATAPWVIRVVLALSLMRPTCLHSPWERRMVMQNHSTPCTSWVRILT
eukprot:9498047-Pyramimonas_sp.AAC.2